MSRDDPLSRRDRKEARRRTERARQRGKPRARHQSRRIRIFASLPDDEDRRAEAGARSSLSDVGKLTIANMVKQKLSAMARHTMLLGGNNVRRGLNRHLGFTEAGRVENIRRAGEIAKLMTDAGLIAIGSSRY